MALSPPGDSREDRPRLTEINEPGYFNPFSHGAIPTFQTASDDSSASRCGDQAVWLERPNVKTTALSPGVKGTVAL